MRAELWRQPHDALAGVMAALAADGAAQAINLTGLTLKAEMDMALRIGQYRSTTLVKCHSCLNSAYHILLADKALHISQYKSATCSQLLLLKSTSSYSC